MKLIESIDWNYHFDQLANKDYTVVDNFLPKEVYQNILSQFIDAIEDDLLQQAGIGALSQYQIIENIRNDEIMWLDRNNCNPEIKTFFNFIDAFIPMVNRELYTSIKDSEFHLAHYQKGGFYKKHLDQFKDRNNRILSVIVYMNDQWKKGDGGELKIYTNDSQSEFELVEPIGNRLAIFRSDTVWHEVLPANKSRKSLTGWLLRQPPGLGFLASTS
jgi:SM-20-related protein